ncbi:tetratricopeptide repeat protein [Lewinella sp. W8]|uniref:tetratricopeptide repeat protein n=1 Tax=Lewinella sp. W8 TaxID=2528208 RepID=UPI00106820C3|nr:tetratricopeptide repeat protein [Lewinella sp. W8]MTB53886.1 tetratricopeptide repeat protein [Lewinella sp. W8]
MRFSLNKIAVLLPLYFSIVCPFFGQSSPYDSLIVAHQATDAAEALRVDALFRLGAGNFRREYPDSLLALHERAEEMLVRDSSPTQRAEFARHRGFAHNYKGEYHLSLKHLQDSERIARTNKDTAQLIKALHTQSSSYFELSDFDAAIEVLTEGLILSEGIGNTRYAVTMKSSLGLAYLKAKNYGRAREYFLDGLDQAREENDRESVIRSLTNIGVSYDEEGNYLKSNEHHLEALRILEEIGAWHIAGTVLNNVGDTYLKMGEKALAERFLKRGLTVARSRDELPAIARGGVQLANLYRESKPDSARYYARSALNLAQEIGNRLIVVDAARILSQLLEDTGRYREALQTHKLWKNTLDSINDEENERALYLSEARYQYAKEKSADELAFEQELSRQQLSAQRKISLLVGGLVAIVVAFLYILQTRKTKREQEKAKLLNDIEVLRERVAAQSITATGARKQLTLDKEKIERHLSIKLGASSWNILSLLYENPTISNREIAEKIHLSVEGVSSSLRRMYKSFGVRSENNSNLKIALVTKAVKLSLKE